MSHCPNGYKRFFAWALANGNTEYEQAIAERKSALFAGLSGDVLEIGPGTGVNLAYYSTDIHWTGVEPNPFMQAYLQKAAQKHGLTINLQPGTAEQLAVPDSSMDTVISTLVLCSVTNLSQTLEEIIRVLKPGGRLLFIEHVAAPRDTWLHRLQQWIQPVWTILGDGCHPDRETWLALEQAGFERVEYQHFSGPFPIPIVKPHIIGVAFKSGVAARKQQSVG